MLLYTSSSTAHAQATRPWAAAMVIGQCNPMSASRCVESGSDAHNHLVCDFADACADADAAIADASEGW